MLWSDYILNNFGTENLEYSSFIDDFDETKHKISDNKLILVLGKTMVDNKDLDGKCLFIPYHPKDKKDDAENFAHFMYMGMALSKYEFGDGKNHLTRYVKHVKNGGLISYTYLIWALSELGVGIFYDRNCVDSRREDGCLETLFYRPNILSDKQIETIKKMAKALKNENYVIGLLRKDYEDLGEFNVDRPDLENSDDFLRHLIEINNKEIEYYNQHGYERDF